MDLTSVPEWLKIVFIVWGIVSIIAAPIVGRFLAGGLHVNVSSKATGEAQAYSDPRGQLAQLANESIVTRRTRL